MTTKLMAACALAIACATPAHAEFGFKTEACSIAERGQPRVYFKACAVNWGMAQGHAGFRVKTPNGRRFEIHNYYVYDPERTDNSPPPWFIDGKPAKLAGACFENSRISICFDPIYPLS